MSKKPIIIGIGELLWDIFLDKKQPGGAPVDFAFHAGKMGAESYIISAVGQDADGKDLTGRLKRAKINQIVEITDFPTGTALVASHDKSKCHIAENTAWDHIKLTSEMEVLAGNADAVYFGTLAQRSPASRQAIQNLIKLTSPDSFKIFDLNLRQNFYDKNIIEESLLQCNVLKVNSHEFSMLKKMLSIDEDDILSVCKLLLEKYNLKYILYTSGVGYSIAYSSESYSFIKPSEVRIGNTIGAGSTFVSSFIMSILKGQKLPQAHERAVHCATYVCTKNTAWTHNQLWNF